MNIMRKEPEGKYSIILEDGKVFNNVPCLGAYESEREAMGEIYGGRTGDGQVIEGLFQDKASKTGVLFYYEGDPDKTRYVFVKGGGIFEYVFMVEEK